MRAVMEQVNCNHLLWLHRTAKRRRRRLSPFPAGDEHVEIGNQSGTIEPQLPQDGPTDCTRLKSSDLSQRVRVNKSRSGTTFPVSSIQYFGRALCEVFPHNATNLRISTSIGPAIASFERGFSA